MSFTGRLILVKPLHRFVTGLKTRNGRRSASATATATSAAALTSMGVRIAARDGWTHRSGHHRPSARAATHPIWPY